MILEQAIVTIKPGTKEDFESHLADAQLILAKAEGYLGHEFHSCIEEPEKYVLLIRWEDLEAHTVGFRGSRIFFEWRNLIGPYFADTPEVLHFELLLKR